MKQQIFGKLLKLGEKEFGSSLIKRNLARSETYFDKKIDASSDEIKFCHR